MCLPTEGADVECRLMLSPANPRRDWELDEAGQPTQKVIETRRSAKFTTPIPKPKKHKKKAAQQGFVFDEGKGLSTQEQQYDPTSIINEVRAYVAKLADEVARMDEGIASTIRTVGVTDLRSAEQALSALEEKLIAKLKFTADDAIMMDLKRDVDAELNPFRSTMTAAQLAMLEQQMWRRKLLERHNLPRLSLFYLI